jgi:DNA-binding NtrC family response regulator
MRTRHEILVIDDEPIVGERLEVTLKRDGHSVSTFTDPAKAQHTLRSKTFDIVVCDIKMGDINGLDVLSKVLAASPRTKVIMITGYATLEVARESLAKGAFDFIAKPFKLGELRKTIAKAIVALEREDDTSNGEQRP